LKSNIEIKVFLMLKMKSSLLKDMYYQKQL